MNFLEQLNSLLSDFKIYSLGLGRKNTIVFFDIDDTLFETKAKIIVEDKETNEEILQLTSSEFTNYKIKENEKFNFKQFGDAKLFHNSSEVIRSTLSKLHTFQSEGFKDKEGYKNNKIVFITARAKMDDEQTFYKKFESVGVKVSENKVEMRFVGSEIKPGESIHTAKARIMKDYLGAYEYEQAIFFDDAVSNLKAFMKLSSSYSNTKFITINVIDGKLFQISNKRKDTRPVA